MNAFPRSIRRLLLLALALVAAASASAQTIITTAPYDITRAGSYRVGANLSVSTADYPVITVRVPNVELDLGGYTLSAPAVLNSGNLVIDIGAVSNVTIRNGTVVGAGYGIYFRARAASSNHLVENVRVIGSFYVGLGFEGAAPGSTVKNSIITKVGGPNAVIIGIFTHGGVLMMDNAISKITGASGNSCGILAADSDFSIGNTINDCAIGISGGKYLNNLTYGCGTPFANGVNATGNN